MNKPKDPRKDEQKDEQKHVEEIDDKALEKVSGGMENAGGSNSKNRTGAREKYE